MRPKVVICECRNVPDIQTALLELGQTTGTTIVTFGEGARADGVLLSVGDLYSGFDTEPVTEVYVDGT